MNEEKDMLFEYECKYGEISEITKMLWYVIEDYYSIQEKDLYTQADNYRRLETFLVNIHDLLFKECEEMKKIIENKYKNKTPGKMSR